MAVVAVVAAMFPVGDLAAQPVVPAVAPGFRASTATPDPPAVVGVTQQPFVAISLQDAVSMALLRNPNLAITAGNVRIARYNVVASKGAFDTQLHLEPSSSNQVTPPINVFFAGPGQVGKYRVFNRFCGCYQTVYAEGPGNILQHVYQFEGGFGGQTANGLLWNASITRSRTFNNTLIDFFNPYYQSSLNLTVTQPLLRNAGMNSSKRDLKLSLIDADASEAQALVYASDTISQVDSAYWDLVAAWRNVAIQEDALKEAIAQQRNVTKLAKQGVAAPILVTEAGTQIANFQSSVYSSLESVADVQARLKSLIVLDTNDPIWSANLMPSSPVQQFPSAGDLQSIVALGLTNRPEMRIATDQRRQADLAHAYAKNQELPQADLYVNYQSNGFAGVPQPEPSFQAESCAALPGGQCPTPAPYLQGKMGQATANMWSWKYPTFNIALVVNVPLENGVAHSLVRSAVQAQEQADITIQDVQQRIGVEARNALQVYQSALSRLYAARAAREAAQSVDASEFVASTRMDPRRSSCCSARPNLPKRVAASCRRRPIYSCRRVAARGGGNDPECDGVNLETLGSKALKTTP